jgi:hypothetical protein
LIPVVSGYIDVSIGCTCQVTGEVRRIVEVLSVPDWVEVVGHSIPSHTTGCCECGYLIFTSVDSV